MLNPVLSADDEHVLWQHRYVAERHVTAGSDARAKVHEDMALADIRQTDQQRQRPAWNVTEPQPFLLSRRE